MSSISTTRRVLAVMAVTTALCADRVAVVSPGRPQRVEISQIASRLVSRLAQNFRRVIPAAFPEPTRQQGIADPVAPQFAAGSPVSLAHPPLSPFQFRLPPPLL